MAKDLSPTSVHARTMVFAMSTLSAYSILVPLVQNHVRFQPLSSLSRVSKSTSALYHGPYASQRRRRHFFGKGRHGYYKYGSALWVHARRYIVHINIPKHQRLHGLKGSRPNSQHTL